MVEDKWLCIAAIPVVVFLVLSIVRRIRDLNSRIDQLKREETTGPVNPYQAMFDMASSMKPEDRSKSKSPDRN